MSPLRRHYRLKCLQLLLKQVAGEGELLSAVRRSKWRARDRERGHSNFQNTRVVAASLEEKVERRKMERLDERVREEDIGKLPKLIQISITSM